MNFTVLGATGFVGSHLVEHFKSQDIDCWAPKKGDPQVFLKPMGHVIYCIGLTADFREKPLETAEAHVSVLVEYLRKARFDSFLYLSSTRVYEGAISTDELSDLSVNPNNPNHIFNLTKLAGETACLSQKRPEIRIARLSNVLGDDFKSKNFVLDVMGEMIAKGQVTLRTTPDSSKDNIWIDDVVELLPQMALKGRQRIYNVASGKNLDNKNLLEKMASLTGAQVIYGPDAQKIVFIINAIN